MYGKIFESMFTGSMFGQGPVLFAVWAYVISHVNGSDSIVEINPNLIAATIGCPVSEVDDAIEKLCQPDTKSRTKDEDGKRLIKIGEFAYHVVTHKKYREMRTNEDRREYFREYRRKKRGVDKCSQVNNVNNVNNVNSSPEITYADADADAERGGKKRASAPPPHQIDLEKWQSLVEALMDTPSVATLETLWPDLAGRSQALIDRLDTLYPSVKIQDEIIAAANHEITAFQEGKIKRPYKAHGGYLTKWVNRSSEFKAERGARK